MNIEALEKMLARGRDDALLRFTLANAYLQSGDAERAVPHLREALAHDPGYSAAWKLLGRTLADQGDQAGAAAAYTDGIAAAESGGDLQAAKEMRVFLRRVQKAM